MMRYVITLRAWLAARLDTIGMGLSGLCAVHCLAMPLLLGSGILLSDAHGGPDDPTHTILFALAGPISLVALWRGYRHHGLWQPLVVGSIGVALLGRGLFLDDAAALARSLTLTGAGILAMTHLYNWRRHMGVHAAGKGGAHAVAHAAAQTDGRAAVPAGAAHVTP